MSCQSQKIPISIVTRCVKFYLKRERVPPQTREFHVLVLSLFIVSRLYLPSISDRSVCWPCPMSVLLLLFCACVFSFLGLNATMSRIVPSVPAIIRVRLHVLREPADALAVALAHDDGAHEDLHGANALESNLALASCRNPNVSTKSLLNKIIIIIQRINLLVW
jgi:hypothetical protein